MGLGHQVLDCGDLHWPIAGAHHRISSFAAASPDHLPEATDRLAQSGPLHTKVCLACSRMSTAELRALRAELEALRLTVVSQGERISELEAKTETGAEGSDHFSLVSSLPEEVPVSEG